MADTIQIENIGPIDTLEIPMPDSGGVVVLSGRNGAGKTHALEATQALLRGSGRVPCRDGAARGTVDGLGAQISVSRNTRRKGELTVDHIEGRLSVGEIIDPGIVDPAAADAKRIRALVQVTGVQADPARFHGLLGGVEGFAAVVPPDALATKDLVEMAIRVKRAIDGKARVEAKEATRLDGLAEGLEVAAGDEGDPVDPVDAQRCLEAALRDLSTIEERNRAAKRAATQRVQAEEVLRDIGEPPDVDALQVLFDDRQAVVEAADNALADATATQRQARSDLEVAKKEKADASRDLETAKREAAVHRQFRAVLDNEETTAPSDQEMADASTAVTEARSRVADAAVAERARDQRAQASGYRLTANETRQRETVYRDAAMGVDDVLSVAVDCERLTVVGGRLVVETDRGTTPYADLSHGERARIAVDVAADRVGAGGLIPLAQEVWEGFDPDNRAAIAEHAQERGVVILTAEATSGVLVAETFEAGSEVEA